MTMNINQDAIDSETNLYKKNPTHLEIQEMAESQQDIVDILTASDTYQFGLEEYHYMDGSTKFKPLMGIVKLREMNEKELVQFFKTAFRYRSNIINVHLKLGEYKNKKKLNNSKVMFLNNKKKILHTEIGEKVAEIFADKAYNVIEIKYSVSKDPKNFFTKCEVFYVDDEDYNNDELFSPAFGIEYFTTH